MVPEKSIVIQILFLGKVWFFKATFKIFIFLFSFQWFNSMYDIDFFFMFILFGVHSACLLPKFGDFSATFHQVLSQLFLGFW